MSAQIIPLDAMVADLHASTDFVSMCRIAGVTPAQAKAVVLWLVRSSARTQALAVRSAGEETLKTARNIRTRASLIASWRAAQKMAEGQGAIVLNYASAAGFLLDQHVAASVAIALCPAEPWWATVKRYLEEVAAEEAESK